MWCLRLPRYPNPSPNPKSNPNPNLSPNHNLNPMPIRFEQMTLRTSELLPVSPPTDLPPLNGRRTLPRSTKD